MNPTHTGPIGYTKLMLWPHKYKVGHIDLILMTPKSPENLNFPMCHTVRVCNGSGAWFAAT